MDLFREVVIFNTQTHKFKYGAEHDYRFGGGQSNQVTCLDSNKVVALGSTGPKAPQLIEFTKSKINKVRLIADLTPTVIADKETTLI